ncbi:MAG TPA: EAL domain-containing protein [Gammaproteobacteria bacterium]|nr:EAL domain-containing protein [Gammaproteobacteria bacterium]
MEDKLINLIIIDDSFDSEEKIISTLRTSGYTARSTRVEDDEDLLEALSSHTPDLIIYFEGMELISLKQTLDCLKKNKKAENARVIVVNKTEQPDVITAMRTGAVDATCFSDINHLILIIAREYQAHVCAKKVSTIENAFRESERRCNALLDSSRDAIAYIHEGMHVYSNRSYLEMFGIEDSDDLEGMPVLDMIAIERRDEFKRSLREYSKTDGSVEKLKTILHKPDGEDFEGEMEFSPAQIDGEPCIQIVIRKEGVNSEELEKQLKLISQKDQLTGLFNRQYCIDQLEDTIANCETGRCQAALMEIHIDNFEDIKNTVGVIESDQYIREAAKVLQETVNSNDVLSRYTHDSFAIIAYDYNRDNIEAYASEIQNAISQLETSIKDTQINTTVSIGIALIDKDSPEYNEILARSEKAVASAIKKGSNSVHIYVPEKGELTRHEVDARFKSQLTEALKNDHFVLHYQPIVSLHGDTDERYEVFVRLAVADSDELIMPHDFLPAAERIGMSIAIDRWVLDRTIKDYLARKKLGKNTRFFIKMSSSSLKDDTLYDWLKYQIKEHNLGEYALNFAVKESAAVTNLKNAKSLSHKLKTLKCGFVLDNFGNGTNPFQLLNHIHADYLRFDSIFMENLTENPQNQDTIKRMSEQAGELGKLTIAQHVPDATSLSILWGMGVNFIQGYFLQEPMPVMEYDFTEMSG